MFVHKEYFSLSAYCARQVSEEWGELIYKLTFRSFGVFYKYFWAA
jgi:hypothetical protein